MLQGQKHKIQEEKRLNKLSAKECNFNKLTIQHWKNKLFDFFPVCF